MKYFRLSAEQENIEAYAMLGWCYEKGLGVEQDRAEANQYYQIAADGSILLHSPISAIPIIKATGLNRIMIGP